MSREYLETGKESLMPSVGMYFATIVTSANACAAPELACPSRRVGIASSVIKKNLRAWTYWVFIKCNKAILLQALQLNHH